NTKKSDLALIKQPSSVPYIRLLGLTQTGQTYLNKRKKDIAVPIVHKLGKDISLMLKIDERARDAYYSILRLTQRYNYRQQKRQTYLNKRKKCIAVPIIHKLGKDISLMLKIDERASDAYYSILTPTLRYKYRQQERHGPIRLL